MKRTQFIDACRNIRKEFVAWLSIVVIGLLAALSFLSIAYSAATLRKDALHFFNSHELWDLEIASLLLLDDEDLEAVRALPGVERAEPVWQIDTRVRLGGVDTNVSVVSLPRTISRPELLEGRLPVKADECAVEKELATRCSLSVGDRIDLEVKQISGLDPMTQTSFIVTGVFQTPEHISYMVPATPCILVPEESFNREGLGGAFMKLHLRIEHAPDDRYGDKYKEAVRAVETAVEGIAEERGAARGEKLRRAYEERIAEGQTQLDEGRKRLDDAQKQLAKGKEDLAAATATLVSVAGQLDDGAALLRDGKRLLERYSYLLYGLRAKGTQWAAEHITPEDLPPEFPLDYDTFRLILESSSDADVDWLSSLAEKQLRTYSAKINAASRDWYYAGEEYLDALTRYERGKKELEDAEAALAGMEAEWEAGNRKLQEAWAELEKMGAGRWIVLNDWGNAGFLYADANASKLSSLSMSFSSIFLIVGALVIYATIGRMVEQHRSLIGTVKAMGLYNREIFAKYLFFACTAALLGAGLGIALAWGPLQRVILSSYEKLLCYGTGTRSFLPLESGLVVAGALGISAVAVYLGCSRLLRESAIRLMQNAMDAGKRKKARRSAGSSLFYRLVFRNMRTDLSRVAVTIVSIAGGCVLMVTGFTLRYGISGVPDRQFGGILTYEAEVFYDSNENPDAAAQIEAILDKNGLPHVGVRKADSVFEAEGSLSALTLIAAEPDAMEGYFRLADLESGEILSLPESGALVPRRFWEHYGIGAGQTVPVYDGEMRRCSLKVAGVFENYYGQLFFLTPEAYEEAFGAAPAQNCFFVKTGDMSLDALREELADVRGLVKVADAAEQRHMIEQFTAQLNFVVWLMLFIAGMMACFIVANFTMTYIQRKTRELTIMRINGFSAAECIRYSAVDLVVTTVLGTLIGLAVGHLVGHAVLSTTETPYIQMVRQSSPQTYLYSALITCGFSILTNSFALQRIKKLKLSDLT